MPILFWRSRNRRISFVVSIVILLFYAGFARWAFGIGAFDRFGGVVSMSFLWSVPFALGALSVAMGRWSGSDRWLKHAIGGPTVVLTLGFLISFVTKIEAAMCVVMAAPVLYVAGWLGGLIAHWLLPRNRDDRPLYMTLAAFLPLIAACLESTLHWPTQTLAIEDTITIQAPAEHIWREIASVPAIPPGQIPNRWIYRLGFPKPVAATLDREGVGGIRTATFERQVSFFETVTSWDQPRRLSFTIRADPDFIPHTAFDRHIIVGGRFFDVLDGLYEIERLSPGTCRLHLTSHHRLTTRFNAYAGWWSGKVMREIQGSILEVIRTRAESAQRQAPL